jgi:hypothetical protein
MKNGDLGQSRRYAKDSVSLLDVRRSYSFSNSQTIGIDERLR